MDFRDLPNIRFFIDLHSHSGDILYSWGDDDDQTTDPNMNFQNPTYNSLEGITSDSDYKEYIQSNDLSFALILPILSGMVFKRLETQLTPLNLVLI